MNCKLRLALTVFLTFCCTMASFGETLEEAVAKAMRGNNNEDFDFEGQAFNFKKLSIEKNNNVIVAFGQLSHKVNGGKNDRITYTIRISGPAEASISYKLEGGEPLRFVGPPGGIAEKAKISKDGSLKNASARVLDKISLILSQTQLPNEKK